MSRAAAPESESSSLSLSEEPVLAACVAPAVGEPAVVGSDVNRWKEAGAGGCRRQNLQRATEKVRRFESNREQRGESSGS